MGLIRDHTGVTGKIANSAILRQSFTKRETETMANLTRRTILSASAALPFAGAFSSAARADAPMMGNSFAQHRRFQIGDFEVTTILAGTTPRGCA